MKGLNTTTELFVLHTGMHPATFQNKRITRHGSSLNSWGVVVTSSSVSCRSTAQLVSTPLRELPEPHYFMQVTIQSHSGEKTRQRCLLCYFRSAVMHSAQGAGQTNYEHLHGKSLQECCSKIPVVGCKTPPRYLPATSGIKLELLRLTVSCWG